MSKENIATLQWLAELNKEAGIAKEKNIDELRILFATNHLAFFFDGPYAKGIFRTISELDKNFDRYYGVAKIPMGPAGSAETVLLSHALAISRTCKEPELAYQWIEYLTQDETHAKQYFDAHGVIPCMRDMLHKSLPYIANTVSEIIIQGKSVFDQLTTLHNIINVLSKSNDIIL